MVYRLAAQDREVTPLEEDWIDDYKREAYGFHDLLLQMGGRPTRTVLEEPTWKAIYEKDEIRIVEKHGGLQGTVSLDENLTLHHWKGEYFRFEEEVDRWQEFRDYQKVMEPKPLLKTAFDPKNTDERLIKILVRLNDWREFQYYQQVKVGRALMLVWKITRNMENFMRKEATTNDSSSSLDIQNSLATCFQQLFPRQMGLEASQVQLTWVESQIPEILIEACASLEAAFPILQQLEMKLEQQANAFNQELKALEAKPGCSAHSPHQSADLAHRIRHWGSEITRLMREHWEWKIFLKWRNNQRNTEQTANIGEQRSSGRLSDLQILVDYVSYRRFQLDRAQSWVASWQRLQKSSEDDIQFTPRDQGLSILENTISTIRAYVEKFQQDVRNAELQVRSAEQQLAELSSQRVSPAPIQMKQQSNGHPHLAPGLPDSASTESIPETPARADSSRSATKVNRARDSTYPPPISGIPCTIHQPSKASKREKGTQEKGHDLDEEHPVTVTDVVDSEQVMVDNDIQTIDALDSSFPDEEIGDGGRAKSIETPMNDVEYTLMTDGEDPDNSCSHIASQVHSKARGAQLARNHSLLIHQVPTSRKTRSAKKLNRTISSRVLKDTCKKPTGKSISLTGQQAMAVLGPTAVNGSPTDSPLLRRSERLKEKAAATSSTSPPQVKATEPSKGSRPKKVGEQPSSVKSFHPPRQKKPKVQPSALKSPRTSRQRKPKIPINDVGPSLSSRRKRLKT